MTRETMRMRKRRQAPKWGRRGERRRRKVERRRRSRSEWGEGRRHWRSHASPSFVIACFRDYRFRLHLMMMRKERRTKKTIKTRVNRVSLLLQSRSWFKEMLSQLLLMRENLNHLEPGFTASCSSSLWLDSWSVTTSCGSGWNRGELRVDVYLSSCPPFHGNHAVTCHNTNETKRERLRLPLLFVVVVVSRSFPWWCNVCFPCHVSMFLPAVGLHVHEADMSSRSTHIFPFFSSKSHDSIGM